MEGHDKSDHTMLKHVIPYVGVTEIVLHPPADEIYRWLESRGEVGRLSCLRHLGALSVTFPGARHVRWDYTLAMLYYASQLKVPGMMSRCRIGDTLFSSALAALQSVCLLWNVGHLPGTYSVEKGVYQYLFYKDRRNPASGLPWTEPVAGKIQKIRSASNTLLRSEDYTAVSRILTVIKSLRIAQETDVSIGTVAEDLLFPFLLNQEEDSSHQCSKLRVALELVRHLAYLTLDTAYTGLKWSPNIPALFDQVVSSANKDLAGLSTRISEILSPVERSTYELIYHCPEARTESSLVSARVFKKLSNMQDPSIEIDRWLRCGRLEDLQLVERYQSDDLHRVAAIRLRSHFALPTGSPVEIEERLRKKGLSHPTVFEYKAWNSEFLLEPDEYLIDALTDQEYTPHQIGWLLLWVMESVDDLTSRPEDSFSLLVKRDVETTYRVLLSRCIERQFQGIHLQLEPWPLARFGLFNSVDLTYGKGAIWASNGWLNDPVAKYLLRNRAKSVDRRFRDAYAELTGLRELRTWLRRTWGKKKEMRQRFLIITASIRLQDDSRRLMEFDGGLLKVSTRSGRITWYGLESKRGRSDPLYSLERRRKVLSIPGKTTRLSSHYAFLEVEL